jgi:hypothetical protein
LFISTIVLYVASPTCKPVYATLALSTVSQFDLEV